MAATAVDTQGSVQTWCYRLHMDSDLALRLRVWQFYKVGVQQRALADKMGLSESTLSRWVKKKAAPLRNTATDGFEKFLREFRAAVAFDPQALSKPQVEEMLLEIDLASMRRTAKRSKRRRATADKARAKR